MKYKGCYNIKLYLITCSERHAINDQLMNIYIKWIYAYYYFLPHGI